MNARYIRATLRATLWALALGLTGFLVFCFQVERQETVLNRHADGMIVLTGGADRVADAISLFSQGHAERMLITGVNPGITRAEIARLNPKYRDLIDCCVDLGYEAVNTFGNAKEARRWAERSNILRTIIVVTSNYHMPRALAELHNVLPAHELIPYSVISPRMREDGWWQSPHTLRLFASEYVKYVLVMGRIQIMKIWTRSKAVTSSLSNGAVAPR